MHACDAQEPLGKTSLTLHCPVCGETGKKVSHLTVGALLKPQARRRFEKTEFFFCKTEHCGVVYFSKSLVFKREDIQIQVGQKTKDPARLVCYCFGYTEAMILDDLKKAGTSSILKEIEQRIKKGVCFCEVTNPQGSCCLGNIREVIKKHKRYS